MRTGVLLCGCGMGDGSAVEEVMLTYLALDKYQIECVPLALNEDQHDVADHLTEKITGEKRNMLAESARIGRGKIADLCHVEIDRLDGLIIPGGDLLAVVDPGAGRTAFEPALGERHVDLVINTHYHFDHINGNYLFPEAGILLNPVEAACFPDLTRVGELLGIQEYYGESGVAAWIENVKQSHSKQTPFSPSCRHEWWLSTRAPAGEYLYDRQWHIGKVKVIMVHAPGHTRGFCCPYFPDEGVTYTGDIDLTSFGPWYAGSDGDIDAFIQSARRIALLDADRFITGHQEGVLSRSQFQSRLDRFLNIIEERQRRLAILLDSGVKPEEVPNHGLLYPPKYQVDPWLKMWESIAVRKHHERLQKHRGSSCASSI